MHPMASSFSTSVADLDQLHHLWLVRSSEASLPIFVPVFVVGKIFSTRLKNWIACAIAEDCISSSERRCKPRAVHFVFRV